MRAHSHHVARSPLPPIRPGSAHLDLTSMGLTCLRLLSHSHHHSGSPLPSIPPGLLPLGSHIQETHSLAATALGPHVHRAHSPASKPQRPQFTSTHMLSTSSWHAPTQAATLFSPLWHHPALHNPDYSQGHTCPDPQGLYQMPAPHSWDRHKHSWPVGPKHATINHFC